MDKVMHFAAQYLAAAGISFVAKKEDDSHTNLGFSTKKGSLETHLLSNKGDILSLNYKNFSLDWSSQKSSSSLSLDGITHADVLDWIEQTSIAQLNKHYAYHFHYDLPYKTTNDFRFHLSDPDRLAELLRLRILAQSVLEETLQQNYLRSPIRVWPHHFDSGAYANIKDEVAVGLGLATPDNVCSEHYFYISGYKGHDAISTETFSRLTNGVWKNDAFTGAILPATTTDAPTAILFFTAAIKQYKTIE